MPTTLELTIRRLAGGSHSADARLTSDASAAATQLAANIPVALDESALLALVNDPAAYGTLLRDQLFADPNLRNAWLKARAYAATGNLQFRLNLDTSDAALHAMRWETLRDPESGQPIALHERVRLVRALDSADLTPIIIPPRPSLRALVAVASPSNLADFGLAEVDVDGEVARARSAFGDIPTVLLGDHAGAAGQATLANISAQLHEAPTIVILVAHGSLSDDGPVLWLEREDGAADHISGADFVAAVARLTSRPLLLVLASCRSAGAGYGDTLSALGPALARAGIPAVLGFQGDVAMSTVKTLMPTLIAELRRDGQIDRALAAARGALEEKHPWWQAILWLRTDGRLWQEADPRVAVRERTLRPLLYDCSGFIASRMAAFVGRDVELAEIRQRIAEKLPSGGYVTITGAAGQGKSCIIARLVSDAAQAAVGTAPALGEWLPQPAAGVPICHFIPFSPGPDHQVVLLRDLIARLCLTYDLPESYAAAETRPALRGQFAALLGAVAQQGAQAVIYIDGLDQIEEDDNGVRDLSFLPLEPPPGIVFVLGTRPNDTLNPLRLRKPQREYLLRDLSRADFDRVLAHRGLVLSADLASRLYAALRANALYLDLVAQEILAHGALPPEKLIGRIADDPDNLFSLPIDRLRHQRQPWREVLKPILGLLLAAGAPLSARALRTLIVADDESTRDGLQRLGGLIAQTGNDRYTLFHLKFHDFLRQNPAQPQKRYVFAADEEQGFHGRLADWCAGGRGGPEAIWQDAPDDDTEQERRDYARRHYAAHLAGARRYEDLWALIDADTYGAAKRGHTRTAGAPDDPGALSYVRDLTIACDTLVGESRAGGLARGLELLPQLWRYSMLRRRLIAQNTLPNAHYAALALIDDPALAIGRLAGMAPLREAARLAAIGAARLPVDAGLSGDWLLDRIEALLAPDANPAPPEQLAVIIQAAALIDTPSRLDRLRDRLGPVQPAAMDWVAAALALAEAALRLGQADAADRHFAAAQEAATGAAKCIATVCAALGRAGRPSAAQELAATITNRWDQAAALAALAEGLAPAGDVATINQICADISADLVLGQARAVRALAEAQAVAGQLDAAEATAATVGEASQRIRALLAVGRAGRAAGHEDVAVRCFDAAEALARRDFKGLLAERGDYMLALTLAAAGRGDQITQALIDKLRASQHDRLSPLVAELLRDGDLATAQRVAQQKNLWARQESLALLAQRHASAGQIDAARSLLNIGNNRPGAVLAVEQVAALGALAAALQQAGREEAHRRAVALLAGMRAAIEPWMRTELIAALLVAGAPDRAEEASRSLVRGENPSGAAAQLWSDLAITLARHAAGAATDWMLLKRHNAVDEPLAGALVYTWLEVGASAGAMRAAGQQRPPTHKRLLVAMAEAHARAGRLDGLRQVLEALADVDAIEAGCMAALAPSDDSQVAAHLDIAEGQARALAAVPRAALDAAPRAALALGAIARARALRGEPERAEELLGLALAALGQPGNDVLRAALAEAVALVRGPAAGQDVAEQIVSPESRASAALAIAHATIERRTDPTPHLEAAEHAARLLDSDVQGSRMRARIAAAWCRAGDPRRAAQVARMISQHERRAAALRPCLADLAAAGHADEAVQLGMQAADPIEQAQLLGALAAPLAAQPAQLLALILPRWPQAQTQSELFQLFQLALPLCAGRPALAEQLLASWEWALNVKER